MAIVTQNQHYSHASRYIVDSEILSGLGTGIGTGIGTGVGYGIGGGKLDIYCCQHVWSPFF